MVKKPLRQRLEELTRTNKSDPFCLSHVILCEVFLELLGPEPKVSTDDETK